MIHLSHNELLTTCSKALSGLHRKSIPADRVAQMLLEMELLGLNVINLFVEAIEEIRTQPDQPENSFNIEVINQNHVQINLQGRSLIPHLPLLLDYACEKFQEKNFILEINSSHHQWFIVGTINSWVQLDKPYYVRARWFDEINHEIIECLFDVSDNNRLLDKYHFNHSNHSSNTTNLNIELSHQPFNPSPNPSRIESREDFKKNISKKYKEGFAIKISDWDRLKQAAKHILVESDSISASRAGGI